jgi:hypothetical protein
MKFTLIMLVLWLPPLDVAKAPVVVGIADFGSLEDCERWHWHWRGRWSRPLIGLSYCIRSYTAHIPDAE